MILVEIQPSAREEMSIKGVFLVLALVTILFSRVESFSTSGTGQCKQHFCKKYFEFEPSA